MKSAFELAMEKYGDEPIIKLTDAQKEALTEIDKKYQAKIAEAELSAQDRQIKTAGNRELCEQINQDLAVEKASFRERCECEKEKIRNENN